jgi:diaminopimelate decarboxylase
VERSGAHGLAVLPPGSIADDRTRRLVVVDAGMTELIRPALYGADHAIVALTSRGRVPRPDAPARPTRVDGPICESTDTLGEHFLPALRRGDLVAIADAGAYAASMRSTYNGRPRPAEVIVGTDGTLTLARRRGTPASLA